MTCKRKENFLTEIIKRRDRGWFLRPHGETRSLILNYLDRPSTIRELGRMAQIHFSRAAAYVHKLENDGLVERIGEIKGANLYQRVGQ